MPIRPYSNLKSGQVGTNITDLMKIATACAILKVHGRAWVSSSLYALKERGEVGLRVLRGAESLSTRSRAGRAKAEPGFS